MTGILFAFLASISLTVTTARPQLRSVDWRPGDEITAFQDGRVFVLRTDGSGPTAEFRLEGDCPSPDREMHIGFSVKNINNGKPDFSVESEQTPGEPSNRLPQYAVVAPSSSEVKMTGLARAVEFSIRTRERFLVTRIAFLVRSSSDITGLNPSPTDLKDGFTGCVILPEKDFGKVPLIVNFFNGGRRNARYEITDFSGAPVDFGTKEIGIRSTEDFIRLVSDAAAGDKYGLRFCDDRGVVCLRSDIDLSAAVTADRPWNGLSNFQADFDGCGHAIYGYRIVNPGGAAIFVSTYGSVRNLQFGRRGDGSVFVSSRPDYAAAAPIAATMSPTAVVENCTNWSDVKITSGCKGTATAGGIVAQNRATVRGCVNHGAVEIAPQASGRPKYAGGIVGCFLGDWSSSEECISDCANHGAVCSRSSARVCVGGIAGRLAESARPVTLTRCTNDGEVSLRDSSGRVKTINCIGGIVGEAGRPIVSHDASRTAVSECINSGPVITDADGLIFQGGIAGRLRAGSVRNSNNSGAVSHTFYGGDSSSDRNYAKVGGVAGDCTASSILACGNSGAVSIKEEGKLSASSDAGGIVGTFSGDRGCAVSGCTNSAAVTNSSSVPGRCLTAGGIIGSLVGGTVRSCVNAGVVCAINNLAREDVSAFAGGVAGKSSGKQISYINKSLSRAPVSADAPNALGRDFVEASPTIGYSFNETVIK